MSFVIVLLAGCTNVEPPAWAGGGTRYASGYAGALTEDSGGGGEDTAVGGEGAPVLESGTALYDEPNEADQVYISAGVAYTDDPDDVTGGRLYYVLAANGVDQDEGNRTIVDDQADYTAASDAWAHDGVIDWQIGPVDTSQTHVLRVYVVDYTHNRSETLEIDVTGA